MNAQSDQIPQYHPDPAAALATPVRRSWLRRNWLWLLGGLFLCGLVFIGGLFMLVFGAMRSSDVAKEATNRAHSNPAVLKRLGAPIEEGWLLSGSINVAGSSGDADLAVPISGPKGTGKVSVAAHKSGGTWNYSTMQAVIDSTGERIDLLASPSPMSESSSGPANPVQPAQSAAALAPATPPGAGAGEAPSSSASPDPQPNNAAQPSSGTPTDVIQSQDANSSGVIAEITQAVRSEGVLTIKLRFRNTNSKAINLTIIESRNFPAFYVTASSKKYFILKDTDGTYLAPQANSWDHSTLQVNLDPGQSYTWWAKFPAPPAEVKKITFITPLAPPFEDVPLGDR